MAFICLLGCGKLCEPSEKISDIKWDNLKVKARDWSGLDTYGHIYDSVVWENGPKDKYMHKSCYLSISTTRKLEQAKIRGKKREQETSGALNPETSSQSAAIEGDDDDTPGPAKRLRSSIGGPTHDKTKCIWCMEGADVKHRGRKHGTLFRINTLSAWRSFKRHIVLIDEPELKDRLTKLVESTAALSDPFASDIKYHYSCWQKYVSNLGRSFHTSDSKHIQTASAVEAKSIFLKHIDDVIFVEHEIRSLQSLLQDYKRIMGEHGYEVGNLKSSYLKELLMKEYKDSIGFRERVEKNRSEWVYDTRGGGDYIQAAISSLGISDDQLIQNIAPRLSKEIKQTTCIPWPPSIEDLEDSEEISPLLIKLLTLLRSPTRKTADISPTTLSLASMITCHVSRKRTASTVKLGITLHGTTRSKELTNMMHKSGTCISYEDVQMLYDYWALQDVEASSSCPHEIADGKPAIVIVDNDDFKADTLSGDASGAHRTNVMYLQPMKHEKQNKTQGLDVMKKNEVTSRLKEKCEELTKLEQYRCPAGASSEPPVRPETIQPRDSMSVQRTRSIIHALSRSNDSGTRPTTDNQRVPSFSGFQSCFHEPPGKSKPYYHTTYPEPPSKSVLHDVMKKLANSLQEKRIPFAFIVGDMPTYKSLVQLTAENPVIFSGIVPILGAFHQQMSYIHAIYKRFKGSGIADILVSADVIAGGSVDQALKGKHYRRGVRCILLLREVFIFKRLQEILSKPQSALSDQVKESLAVLRKPLEEPRELLLKAHQNLENNKEVKALVKRVYQRPGTDMGDFWISFLEMSDPLAQNIYACHTQNGPEYISSTYEMLSGLMAYDNHEYARHLSDFWAMISTLPVAQKEFFNSHFSQSLSGLPYSCMPLDMWIETTMNLNSKLKQGWLNLLQNEKQLFSTTRNANNVARIKTALHKTLNCKHRNRQHTECQPARLKKDEEAIKDLMSCLQDFNVDPFDLGNPTLRSLQTNTCAPPELVKDLNTALVDGQTQIKALLQERVFSKSKMLAATIKKNKRKNFNNYQLWPSSRTPIRQEQMEKTGLAALLSIVEGSGTIQLEAVLENRVTEECLSIFNVDGSMRKTAKSKLLEFFDLTPVNVIPDKYVSIVDMGLIWRLATPTAEDREGKKRDGTSYRWKDYLDKIISLIDTRHANASLIILVNDRYDMSFSIKDDEHDRRASKHQQAHNQYPKLDEKFPGSVEFSSFMVNSANKLRLQNLLKTSLRQHHHAEKLIYFERENAINLGTGDSLPEFSLKHTEADTMLLTVYAKLRSKGETQDVVLDSEDTDVYVHASFVSQDITGELYMKRKKDFVRCCTMLTKEIATVIIAAHVISGSDHTSGFYGHGKKLVLKTLISDPEARDLLADVGTTLPLSSRVRNNMESFVLTKLYGGKGGSTCGQVRADKWRKQKRKTTVRLPPDEESLHFHLQRANYLVYCQKQFELREHPSPIGHGWDLQNGRCRPVRFRRPALPQQFSEVQLPTVPGHDTESSDDEEGSECGESSDSEEES